MWCFSDFDGDYCVFYVGLSELFGLHGSFTRALDEDACLSGLCKLDVNTGLCHAVHDGPFDDVADNSGFRLTMIDDLYDDRLAMLWEIDCERGRKRRALKIGYIDNWLNHFRLIVICD